MITNAVDRITSALDPVEIAKRKAALGELSLAPQELALKRAQLSRMTQLYTSDGSGGGGNTLDPTPQMYWNGSKYSMESPGQAIVRSKNAAAYHATESEANAHNALVAKANAYSANQQAAHQTPQYVMKPLPELNIPSGITMQGPAVDLSNATISPMLVKPKEEDDDDGS